MSLRSEVRQKRHEMLLKKLEESPFLTDGELANALHVSIATIRLDRTALGIPELRERVLSVAHEQAESDTRSLSGNEIMDIEEGVRGVSILHTNESMCFSGKAVVKGQCLYAMAEELAVQTAGLDAAMINVANIKYKIPVTAGVKLIARSEVRAVRENSPIVWVSIYCERQEIFRVKFILNGEIRER